MIDQAEKPAAFISYASQDQAKAFEICRLLEAHGLKCWIAPRNVRAGREYADEIVRGIESAGTMVLLLSKAANDSIFVRREVERAVSKNKPVFPMRIENVQPSPALEFFVSSTHWLDAYSGSLSDHVDRLARDISGGAIVVPERAFKKKLPIHIDRKMALRIGVPVAVALAIFGYFATREPDEKTLYERQVWQGAALSNTVQGYETYLRLVGDDARHARQAKKAIASIQEDQAEQQQSIDVRKALLALGYDAGASADPKSEKFNEAIKAFQSDNKLKSDGKVSAALADKAAEVSRQRAPEIAAHTAALSQRTRMAYETFLAQYGSGKLADDVRARLRTCKTVTTPSAVTKTQSISATASGANCQAAEGLARNSLIQNCAGGQVAEVNVSSEQNAAKSAAAGALGGLLSGVTKRNFNLNAPCDAHATGQCVRQVMETKAHETCS